MNPPARTWWWFAAALLAVAPRSTLAADASPPAALNFEEALKAKQKAEAAVVAAQQALEAAERAKNAEVARKARALITANQKKLAEAETLLRAAESATDPLRDPVFVAAALADARMEVSAAEAAYDEAFTHALLETDEKAADRAVNETEAKLLQKQQAVRDLRTKKQTLEHPQLMADMQRLRQDPALAAELEQVQQRIRQNELAQFNLREEIGSDPLAVRRELKQLRDSGAYRDTADLLAHAQADPRVRAALDRAHTRIMHDQADILRDSTDTLWQEVQRLKQKLPLPPSHK